MKNYKQNDGAIEIFFVKCGYIAEVVTHVLPDKIVYKLMPAKGRKTFNCGQIPTTGGPDTRYSFPKSPTKRVPIT